MPAGNDGRASRRPVPRQLDMSGWSVDSASSSKPDENSSRSSSAMSRDAGDFEYYKTRDSSSRYGTIREDEFRLRQTSESPSLREDEASRTSEFDVRSFSSGRSTIGNSMFDTDYPRQSRSTSSYMGDREELRSIHDNQRETGDRYESTKLDKVDKSWTSEYLAQSSLRAPSERSDTRFTEVSAIPRALNAFDSYRKARADGHFESGFRGSKADSTREAESPVASRVDSKVRSSRDENNKPIRKALEIVAPSATSTHENQDEPLSPTNSETSIPPFSPGSDGDSIRYPVSSIPSPVCPNTSTSRTSASRKVRASSPCSSISTDKTSPCSVSTNKATPSISRQTPSSMTNLREDLYAFRKQMREVFIRVEDMVDVHRSFFKSDPSTGSPVFNGDLQQEAEQLASEAFKQLADLRHHFSRLAKDFQRSEESSTEWTPPRQRRRQRSTDLKRGSRTPSNQISDDEDTSIKGSELLEDNGQDLGDGTCTSEHSPSIRRVSSQDENGDAPVVPVRSTTSTYPSAQLQSRWQASSTVDAESIAPSESATFSARTRVRSYSIASDASSLPDQPHRSVSAESSGIFKDFDKRMEEIRCSLNAIASGKTPPPKISQESPIRAMMDAARTRPTLREASRISTRLDDCSPRTSEHDQVARVGSREAELRQLLQELNHINKDNDDD